MSKRLELLASEIAFLSNDDLSELITAMQRDYAPVVERLSLAIWIADIAAHNPLTTAE